MPAPAKTQKRQLLRNSSRSAQDVNTYNDKVFKEDQNSDGSMSLGKEQRNSRRGQNMLQKSSSKNVISKSERREPYDTTDHNSVQQTSKNTTTNQLD